MFSYNLPNLQLCKFSPGETSCESENVAFLAISNNC